MTSQILNNDEIMMDIEIEECEICYSNFVCNKLNCSTCNKKICIDCCNRFSSRTFKIINNDDITKLDETINHISEGITQPLIEYECPYCRSINKKPLIIFKNTKELIKIVLKDYIYIINNGIITANKNISLDEKILIAYNIAGTHYNDLKELKKELKDKLDFIKYQQNIIINQQSIIENQQSIIDNIKNICINSKIRNIKQKILSFINGLTNGAIVNINIHI